MTERADDGTPPPQVARSRDIVGPGLTTAIVQKGNPSSTLLVYRREAERALPSG
jgi:hypothetical protein